LARKEAGDETEPFFIAEVPSAATDDKDAWDGFPRSGRQVKIKPKLSIAVPRVRNVALDADTCGDRKRRSGRISTLREREGGTLAGVDERGRRADSCDQEA
jgi:hypothetical protein